MKDILKWIGVLPIALLALILSNALWRILHGLTASRMLADLDLLKREIGTSKTDRDLDLDRLPETITDPKAVIRNAIQIARQDIAKRRRRELTIADLYAPIGQQISIDKLKVLPSFQSFMQELRAAFQECNLL